MQRRHHCYCSHFSGFVFNEVQNIACLQSKHLYVGDMKNCHMLSITSGTCTCLMHWSHLIESSKIVHISTGELTLKIV